MARKKPSRNGSDLYLPGRLRDKLSEAVSAYSVFVEAPSGYGKTTLVQDFLLKTLPEGVARFRHVCTAESPQAAWGRLCLTLQRIDADAGEALRRMGSPDKDTLGEAETRLREIDCEKPVWLVIDDFHQIAGLAPASLWKALLEHDDPRLRVALLTRPLEDDILRHDQSGLARFDGDDLRLTEKESGEYFAAAGCPLTAEKTRELHRRAGGWMIALALHLRRYRQNGEFAPAADLDGLLRDVVWNRLGDAARRFLLRLSPFDGFSAEQAAFLAGLPELSAETDGHLRKNAFFRFDDGLCYPHGVLLEFLRREFAALPESERREILLKAGDWCAANGEREKAIGFYYRLRDFEKILTLDLSGLEDNRLLDLPGRAYADVLRDIAAQLTPEMKARHPLSAIQFAFEFFGQGCHREFTALCAEMAEIAARPEQPESERRRLLGELLLMEAFTHYNSIAEMGRRIQRAAQLIGGASTLISPHNSWTFGNPSVLFMYHRDAGRLDAELADMETYAPHYSGMARGHGRGGPALMRAEALLCRGEDGEAEILAHQALHEAGLAGQTSVMIGAELLLGRLALLRGDAEAFVAAEESIDALAQETPQKSNRMEADLARACLTIQLERPQDAAEWLREETSAASATFARRLFTQAIPFAWFCRSRCLLLEARPARLLGEAGAAFSLAEALNCSLARLYGHLHVAAARFMLGQRDPALAALERAFDLAVPDRLWLPLAENCPPLGGLLKELHPGVHAEAEALARRLETGREAVRRDLYAGPSPELTGREYETARLAAEGHSNREIAERLAIAVHTVKAHLKSAFRKTGVKSRAGLSRALDRRIQAPRGE
jgi:LuxR family maltose regulon positive regulatory protein